MNLKDAYEEGLINGKNIKCYHPMSVKQYYEIVPKNISLTRSIERLIYSDNYNYLFSDKWFIVKDDIKRVKSISHSPVKNLTTNEIYYTVIFDQDIPKSNVEIYAEWSE